MRYILLRLNLQKFKRKNVQWSQQFDGKEVWKAHQIISRIMQGPCNSLPQIFFQLGY